MIEIILKSWQIHYEEIRFVFSFELSFRFIAKLSRRYKVVLNIGALPSPRPGASHTRGGICCDRGTYTDASSPRAQSSHQGSLGTGRSMGLDKYIRMYIDHYSVMQSIFTPLRIPHRFLWWWWVLHQFLSLQPPITHAYIYLFSQLLKLTYSAV